MKLSTSAIWLTVLSTVVAGCGAAASPTPSVSPSLGQTDAPALPTSLATPARSVPPTTSLPAHHDGDWIAYQDFDRGEYVINLIRRDGTGQKGITHGIGGTTQEHPDWSPDGTQIAFTVTRGGHESVWLVDVASLDTREIIDCRDDCDAADEPAWSPDGRTIAFQRMTFAGTSTIELYDVGSQAIRVLFTAEPGRGIFAPRWSPDGAHIVFEYTHSDAGGEFDGVALSIIDVAAPTAAREITKVEDFANNPDWSPLGDLIVFSLPINGVTSGGPDGPSDLALVRPDGTGLRRVTNIAKADQVAIHPTFTPEGDRILFVHEDHPGSDWNMALVDLDGSNLEPATATGYIVGGHPRLQPAD